MPNSSHIGRQVSKSKGIYGTKEYVAHSAKTHSNTQINTRFYESASYKEEDRP